MSTSWLTLYGLVKVVSSFLILLVTVHCGVDDICESETEDRPSICPLISIIPNSELGCTKIECNREYELHLCKLGTSTAVESSSRILTEFHVSQCTTDLASSSNYLGLQFSWGINTDNVLGGLRLAVAVEHPNTPLSRVLLNINLTSQLTSNQRNYNFSTACLPLKIVQKDRRLNVKAQVRPASEEPIFDRRVSVTVDCSEILNTLKEACKAPPDTRPQPHFLCENDTVPSVRVTFASGLPPGIKNSRTYSVTIGLKETETGKLRKKIKTLNATRTRNSVPQVIFSNVLPGTYVARFAFNNAENMPCYNGYYNSFSTVTIGENACRPSTSSEKPGKITREQTNVLEVMSTPRERMLDGFLWIMTTAMALTMLSLAVLFLTVRVIKHKRNSDTSGQTNSPENYGLGSVPDTEKWKQEHMDRYCRDTTRCHSSVYTPSHVLADSLSSLPTVDTNEQIRLTHQYLDNIYGVNSNHETGRHISGDSGWASGYDNHSFVEPGYDNHSFMEPETTSVTWSS